MGSLIICWLDDGRQIGVINKDEEGNLTTKAQDAGLENELWLLVESIESRTVKIRKGTLSHRGIIEYEEICKPEDPSYLWAVQDMLYEYMIYGKRIGGYVEE